MNLLALLRQAHPFAARDLDRHLKIARRDLTRASEARRALPAGSPRARVTTANARYMSAAEHVDRLEKLARDLDEATRAPAPREE